MVEKIIGCMENLGMYVEADDKNIILQDYIADSLMYISFIVELEQQFNIEISDEYLVPDKLKTIDDVVEMIKQSSSF